jgi:threonine dehydrogenase-like Zn-dependent dehydrogenase
MDLTGGRGADAVIDAVGMEAHGSPVASTAQRVAGMLPRAMGEGMAKRAGVDRLAALQAAIASVRRCGTVSIVGVYGGQLDPLPMMELFDKGVQLRMGQAHVRRWVEELMPLVEDPADPLGIADLVTHTLPLGDAPMAYEMFQKKRDGCVKVVLRP